MVESNEVEFIKKGNIKLHVFDTFPFDELKKICEAIQALGYDCTVVDNGNFVFQKKSLVMKCEICGKPHDWKSCPAKEDVKKLVIARLESMPDNIQVSIG